MSLLTAAEITNLYLYGTMTLPSDLANEGVIRTPSNVITQTSVDMNEYMDSGAGRFASPALFDVVKLFFSSSTSSGLAPGTYTEIKMRALLGIDQALISQQQWAYDDEQDDYAERVYIPIAF